MKTAKKKTKGQPRAARPGHGFPQVPGTPVGGDLVLRQAEGQREAELAAAARARRLAPYGRGVPFTPETLDGVTENITTLGEMSTRISWEIGRQLVWVEENMPELGRFEVYLSSRVPFSRRTAYTHMALARRMEQTKLPEFAHQDLSKIRILQELTNEEIDTLATKGSLGGISADEIDHMSAAELRDEVRRQRKSLAKGKEQLDEYETTIHRLQVEAGRRGRQCNERFAAQVSSARLALDQVLRLCGKCETAEDLERLVGDRELARMLLWQLNTFLEPVSHLSRLIPPPAGQDETEEQTGGSSSGESHRRRSVPQ